VPRVPRVGGEFANANACVLLGVVCVISDVPRVPRVGGEELKGLSSYHTSSLRA
jgi:hypothetical protein